MNINGAFPSKYLKAADLQGRSINCVIDKVEIEDILGDDPKPVVYFQGKEKGLVLNKTNANMIIEIANGESETDNWNGVKIALYLTKVDFQGKRVDAIRISAPSNGAVRQPSPPVKAPTDDNDIPF